MSKFGEGTGTAMTVCADANQPSYDPATCSDATHQKLVELCDGENWVKLTPWEQKFVSDVYGQSPLTRKQHITVFKIHKKLSTGISQSSKV